jgi:DNA-binding NarL/FixJ family response regulator
VVCLTAEANAQERDEILRAGARGLVEKGDAVEALAAAIRSAAE